tara:strand:+ start:2946 stop:3245 length:300 start_codon:yes stop_codon:yes gene_type:complete
MSHEENGISIPESCKRVMARMDNHEDDTAAFLYAFKEQEIKYLKRINVFRGTYILELVSGGEQLILYISSDLTDLKNKMANFITGINWKERKDQAYLIY